MSQFTPQTITIRAVQNTIVGEIITRAGSALFTLTPDGISRAVVEPSIAAALVSDGKALPDKSDDTTKLAEFLAASVEISSNHHLDLGDVVQLTCPNLPHQELTVRNVKVKFDGNGIAQCPRALAEQIAQSTQAFIESLPNTTVEAVITDPAPVKPIVRSLPAPPKNESEGGDDATQTASTPETDAVSNDSELEALRKELEQTPSTGESETQTILVAENEAGTQAPVESAADAIVTNQDITNQNTDSETKALTNEEAVASEELIELVTGRVARTLAVAGYPTVDACRVAGRETLSKITGVAEGTLNKIFVA